MPQQIVISIIGSEDGRVRLLDLSQFIYQLNLCYEIDRLATDSTYERFKFPVHTFAPSRSKLRTTDQLMLEQIHHESPLSLKTSLFMATGVIGGLLGLTQMVEIIGTSELNREKLKAEIVEIRAKTDVERLTPIEMIEHIRAEKLANLEKARKLKIPLSESEKDLDRTLLPREPSRSRALTREDSNWLHEKLVQREALHFHERCQNTVRRLPFRVKRVDFTIDAKR